MAQIKTVEARLLALLPQDGTPRPNADLKRLLDVPEEEYWDVRNRLLEEGRVTKSPGRGGRTALAVIEDDVQESRRSWVRRWMVLTVFLIAAAALVASVVYGLATWGEERSQWDVIALASGGVTVAAVGVSLLIYKLQTDAAGLEAEGQARILKRLESLARQAATSSVDSRDILQAMGPAVDASSGVEAVPEPVDYVEQGASVPDVDPAPNSETDTIRVDHGEYYLPSAIPLRVLADLVAWWDSKGLTGRWTVARLVGGYRAFNASSNLIGVPWVLTFDGGGGQTHSYRVAYSGRRKGPSISELTESGVWLEFSARED
ncbi:hypothetical protein [Clavibacter californiensis]|nr:hypothetical protein [Clavibacter californiensis]UKF79793.1 hypothetical protein FGD68_13500 [Clavibacter californiensis]